MKDEYDFSQGERGKFYRPNVTLRLPVYLDADVQAFLDKVAQKQGADVQQLVNDWLRANIQFVASQIA